MQTGKDKRRVKVFAPLNESLWIPAEQLELRWTGCEGQEAPSCQWAESDSQRHTAYLPPDGDKVAGWIQDASHWSSNQQGDSTAASKAVHAAPGLTSAEPSAKEAEAVGDTSSNTAEKMAPALSGTAMDWLDSGSSRSSLSCVSREDLPSASQRDALGNGERCAHKIRRSERSAERRTLDAHSAARLSLEQSRRSSLEAVPPAQHTMDTPRKFRRFFWGSPKNH